jgi:capsular polysaccharide biosynthesis protein
MLNSVRSFIEEIIDLECVIVGDYKLQDEINIRDIIMILWNGKWLIAIITLSLALLTAFYSFFMVSPVYQADVLLRYSIMATPDGQQQDIDINSFVQTITSDESVSRIIQKLKLDTQQYSIPMIRNSITVNPVRDAKIFEIQVTGTDPSLIAKIGNIVAAELAMRIEITDRADIIVGAKNELLTIDDQIQITKKTVGTIEEQLKTTPEKLVNEKSLTEDSYLLSVVDGANGEGAKNGVLKFNSEEPNPLYLDLKSKVAEQKLELSRLEEQKTVLNNKISMNQKLIDDLENQNIDELAQSNRTQRMLTGLKSLFIVPAFEPTTPIAPKKTLNVVLAVVIGGMFSVVFVFVRHFFKTAKPNVYTGNDTFNLNN